MRNFIPIASFVLAASAAHAQQADTTTSTMPEHAQPAASIEAPRSHELDDLEAMTFDCPKAGLNAAAREAAKAPTQGTYQFSYFKIIHDAHHAFYEVHFKSNYQSEPDLKYCVSMYCQQGWDPRTSKTMVTLMKDEGKRGRGAACGAHPAKKRRR